MYPATCVVALVLPVVMAGWWDDFSNNLATDLAPFVALLGEQPTKQFLSESLTYWDYFIFSMEPLGIITTVVSVIRVRGGPSLRAFIGRAQEGAGTIEAELCSSTSHDVCEVYNNGGIARIFGRPKLLEVIFKKEAPDTEFEDSYEVTPGGSLEVRNAKAGLYTFEQYFKEQNPVSGPVEWELDQGSSASRFARRWFKGRKDPALAKSEVAFAPNPNLTLNLWMKRPHRAWLPFVSLIGFILQAGIVCFAIIATYVFGFRKDDEQPPRYAVPFMGIGTLLLASGTFLSAYLIGESTEERKFRRSGQAKTDL